MFAGDGGGRVVCTWMGAGKVLFKKRSFFGHSRKKMTNTALAYH